MNKEEYDNAFYDQFIRRGLSAGFTDDQIDFLWEQLDALAKLQHPANVILNTK